MQYMTRHVRSTLRSLPAWAAGLMLHLSLVSAAHASNPTTKVDVPVQALITPAPCTVALTGLTGGVLDLGSQTSESLSTAGAAVGGKSFNVSLTQCGGDIGTTVPTITMSGETIGQR
ncbi:MULTISPECIES: fimbrial protein [unclassified Serratia (in: enterobacteria)]|uniref:fimbrial protein n=1 Tax=unclassified Serratia (in: enterobacteria) TaxID=2647522 RepID=UPI003B42BBAA